MIAPRLVYSPFQLFTLHYIETISWWYVLSYFKIELPPHSSVWMGVEYEWKLKKTNVIDTY